MTQLTGVAPKNFATPYGAYNTTVVNEKKKYYATHRSIDVGYNAPATFNPYTIKTHNAYRDTTAAPVNGWVNYAKANKVGLVICSHEILPDGALSDKRQGARSKL